MSIPANILISGSSLVISGNITVASGTLTFGSGSSYSSSDFSDWRRLAQSVPGFDLRNLAGAFIFHGDETSYDATGSIYSANDAGGGYVQFTSTAKFSTITSGPYGAASPSLRTNNTVGRLFSSVGGPTGAQPWHLAYIGKSLAAAVSPSGFDTWIGFAAPAAAQSFGLGVKTSGQLCAITDDGAVNKSLSLSTFASNVLNVNYNEDHIIEVQYDGIKLKFWVDGKYNSTLDQTITLNLSDTSFGFQNWYSGATYYVGDARIDAAFFRTGGITPREKMSHWYKHALRRLGGTGKLVAFFGDSTTSGGAAGTTNTSYLPTAVKNKAVSPVVIYSQNQGGSGLTSSQILTQLVIPHVDPITHAHVWWGVNDVTAATTADIIYGNTIAAVKHLQKRGAKVIVGTLAQWGALVGSPSLDAIRTAYNSLVIANTAGADVIADISAAMGPYNAANFCADTLHPNDSANDNIIAPCIYAVLSPLGLDTAFDAAGADAGSAEDLGGKSLQLSLGKNITFLGLSGSASSSISTLKNNLSIDSAAILQMGNITTTTASLGRTGAPTNITGSIVVLTGSNLYASIPTTGYFNVQAGGLTQLQLGYVSAAPMLGSQAGLVQAPPNGDISIQTSGTGRIVIATQGGGGQAIYFNANAINCYNPSAQGVVITPGTTPGFAFGQSSTAVSVSTDTKTSDVAPANLTISAQSPFATATNTNRKPGDVIFNLGVPTNNGLSEAGLLIQHSGSTILTTKYTGSLPMATGEGTLMTSTGMHVGLQSPSGSSVIIDSGSGSIVPLYVRCGSLNVYDNSALLGLTITSANTTSSITFPATSVPTIEVTRRASGAGGVFTIRGQTAAAGSAANGGALVLAGGSKDGAGNDGGINLQRSAGNTLLDVGVTTSTAVTLAASVTLGGSGGLTVSDDFTLTSGKKHNLGDATISQAGSITNAVTINASSGVITTQTANAGSNSSQSFTVNNNTVASTSVVTVTGGDYSGTYGSNGHPMVVVDSISSTSFSIRVVNVHATNSLNGTLKIKFIVS